MGWLLISLLALVVGLFVLSGTRPPPRGLPETAIPATGSLPMVSPGGWPRGQIETYDAQTLFEKIDGAADAYLAYDFDGLEFASYTDPARPEAYVDVYLYVMGAPLDAFGIYRAQRGVTEEMIDAGDEACASGNAVFARTGRHYLEVTASGTETAAEARALARALAARPETPGDAVRMPVAFPREGLETVGFDRKDALGVEALGDAFLALYEDGTQVVVARCPTADAAAAAATEARETYGFLGGPATFEVDGRWIIGVVGAPSEERGRALLDAVRRDLAEGE